LQPVKTAPRSLSDQQRSAALRMEADVRAIASVPHNLDHAPALEAAALYIEHELRAAGLLPKIQAFAVGKHTVRNIEVVFEPTAPATAVSLVVGAHYDSAGESRRPYQGGFASFSSSTRSTPMARRMRWALFGTHAPSRSPANALRA
jgi:hypothetical protein